jgi:hypothetical protein
MFRSSNRNLLNKYYKMVHRNIWHHLRKSVFFCNVETYGTSVQKYLPFCVMLNHLNLFYLNGLPYMM